MTEEQQKDPKEMKKMYNKKCYEKHREKYCENEKKKYYIRYLGEKKFNEILENHGKDLTRALPYMKLEKHIITTNNL